MKSPPNPRSAPARFLARFGHLIVLSAFALAGAAVLDDYGVTDDYERQREIGYASFNYILGDADALNREFYGPADRYYGVAFEVPLIAVERLLRLEDSRAVHLSRHLITHLFFLAGGFFAWLLAYRLFGSRLIALFAMLLFLLHPRLYAHSFFNSKDLPFLSMFMVALYLTHRAFRRDSAAAFALCGAGVGLLANMRIIGLMLLPAVLGMLALDAVRAAIRGGGFRWKAPGVRRAFANAAAFLAASAAALYAAWPLLWRDPLELMTAVREMSRHPAYLATLFRGEIVRWPNLPWDFIPAWALITTPPVALALIALGIARLCASGWRDALANSAARFGMLALACLILPVAGAIALNSNLYDDWRQMYFLYAPAVVLAAFGLRALAALGKPAFRAGAFALAALGIAAAAVQTVSLHPYQNDYFNILANKDGIAERWRMNYWSLANREALETLLKIQPTGIIPVDARVNVQILPEEDRRRLPFSQAFPLYTVRADDEGGGAAVWKRELYGAPLVFLMDVRAESEAAFRAAYDSARASPSPDARAGGFDLYADGDSLTLIKEGCGEADAAGAFHALAFPSHRGDLPNSARESGRGYESSRFGFWRYGAMFGGICLIRAPLPDYPLHAVEIERWGDDVSQGALWRAAIPMAQSLDDYAAALSSLPPAPDANAGGFELYADAGGESDRALIYVKRQCAANDADARFFLSVFPSDPDDIPQAARDAGAEHESLNFGFARFGARLGGACVIIRYLPDYAIDRIETGQWLPGEGGLWSAKIPMEGYYARYEDALSSLPGEPSARSDFDLYLEGGTLTYVKRQCAADDSRGRFFLSVFPADADDLPQSARDAGAEHESLNFDFAEHGARVGGACVIIRDLPGYAIDRIETGQWTPEEGGLWSARVDMGVDAP